MSKKLGQDYMQLMDDIKQIPEVKEYLSSFSVIVGDLVIARRMQLNWTQTELAKEAQTTQARISQIESGYEGVKIGTIDKVFKALGLQSIQTNYKQNTLNF